MKTFIAAVLMVASFGASAAWDYRFYKDDFDDVTNHLLLHEKGDQWMLIGCLEDTNFYWHSIEFGGFNFIGSKGSPEKMLVRYGDALAEDETNLWKIWESDGSKVQRTFWTMERFKDANDRIMNAGKFAYRVTSYDNDRFTIRLPSPSEDQLSHLESKCYK